MGNIPDGWADIECDLHSAVLRALEENGVPRNHPGARKIASDAVLDWRRCSEKRMKELKVS